MNKILFKSLIIITLLISVLALPLFQPAGLIVYIRLFLLFLILLESFNLFKMTFIDRSIHNVLTNAGTVLFSLFVMFLFLEAIFMFIPRSHSADYTLASKLWYKKYWKPINSMGFRDGEPDNSFPVILFVGDSFTAGHGLKSVDDRFSNIVGKELNQNGKKYNIINIGKPNADSLGEFNLMMDFFYKTRIRPQIIVLQYWGNDIEYVAGENGIKFEGFKPPANMNKFLIFIGSGSYFFNYLYWLFPREYLGEPYMTFLHRAFKDETILSKHKKELKLFIDYARRNSIKLIVIVFPFLTDTQTSDSLYGNHIVSFFRDHKVNVINVSELVQNIPTPERIVNKNDGHASIKVNRVVAEEIIKTIQQE